MNTSRPASTGLLHIALITFNRSQKLERTLEALSRCSLSQCPITIYDNASTDSTPEVIARYTPSFPQVEVVRHVRNIGGNGNFVQACSSARGTYFWLLCDDDLLDPKACDSILPELEKAEADVLLVNAIGIEGFDEGYKGSLRELQQKRWRFYWLTAFLPSCIYRSSFITSDVIIAMQRHLLHFYPQAELAYSMSQANARVVVLSNRIMERQASGDIGLDWVIYTYGWIRSIEDFQSRAEQVRAFWQRFGPTENWWTITMKSLAYAYSHFSLRRVEVLSVFSTMPLIATVSCCPVVLLLLLPRAFLRRVGKMIKPEAEVEHKRGQH